MEPSTVERAGYMWYAGDEQRTSYFLLFSRPEGWIADVLGDDEEVLERLGPFDNRGAAIWAAESYFHAPIPLDNREGSSGLLRAEQ